LHLPMIAAATSAATIISIDKDIIFRIYCDVLEE
jgi:hypothetical protein